jgi:hypothetical protein
MPVEEPEGVQSPDSSLVVLHHDDAHLASLSRRRTTPAAEAAIPHGCYDPA